MPNFTNQCSLFDPAEQDSNAFIFPMWIFYTFTAFLMMAYMLVRYAEKSNRLEFEDRLTNIIAGFLTLIVKTFHSKDETLALPAEEPALLALGPHRTGWEGVAVATKMEGKPPRFLATTSYNKYPGVASFMKRVKVLPVEFLPPEKRVKGKANSNAEEMAIAALKDKSRVALFPQGNFHYLNSEAPMIYPGVARMAIKSQTPIHVIRLDGVWSIHNQYIPQFIRNHAIYRAFFSSMHMNNLSANLCRIIDFHVQPEAEEMKEADIIREISAQLYAYFKHEQELTPEQIANIEHEISSGQHLVIWDNKYGQYTTDKKLKALKEEGKLLESESVKALDATQDTTAIVPSSAAPAI